MIEICPKLPVLTGNESSDRKSDIIFRILTHNYIYPEIFRSFSQFKKNHPQPAATLNIF